MNWFRFWSLIAMLGLIILLLSYGGVYFFTSINEEIEVMFRNNVDSLTAAQEVRIAYRDLRHQLLRYQLDNDSSRLGEIGPIRTRLMRNLAKTESTALTDREIELTQRVRRGVEDFFARFDAWVANGSHLEELLQINEMLDENLVKEILVPNREYLRLNTYLLSIREKESRELSTRLIRVFVVIGVLGLILGIGGGWLVSSWFRGYQKRIDRKLLSTSRILSHAGRLPESGGLAHGNPGGDLLDDVEGSAKRVAELMRKSELDALRAEQLAKVGQLAAGIAHEIRNPLTSIKMLLQNLERRRGLTGIELSDREWRIMDDEVERMESTLDGFLDFARPPRPVRQPTDLHTVIRESLATVAARAKVQGVKLTGPEPGEPLYAEIDRGQIRQVLSNLFINGLDAQPNGGELRVSLGGPSTSKPHRLEIRVRDHGPGLPIDLGDAIFDPFTSTKDAGLGLGLSISRRIVEGHGGQLEGANHPDGGALFTARIPVLSVTLRVGV